MTAQIDVHASAFNYINIHNVLCLATSRDNQSWVAPVFYAIWQGTFIFLSAQSTRHCKNMALNPCVSASVQEDYANWEDIKGVQLEGKVMPVTETHRESVINSYSQKFPVTGNNAPEEIRNALDKVSWFSLLPSRMYFIDNSRGLGHRDELNVSSLFNSRY